MCVNRVGKWPPPHRYHESPFVGVKGAMVARLRVQATMETHVTVEMKAAHAGVALTGGNYAHAVATVEGPQAKVC